MKKTTKRKIKLELEPADPKLVLKTILKTVFFIILFIWTGGNHTAST